MIITPKALTLFSTDGDHAGFMLIAQDEHENKGDCVFMLSPISVKGIDSKLGILVSELKETGEHPFIITESGQHYELYIKPKNLPEIKIVFNQNFQGNVYTDYDKKDEHIGTVEQAKKKA